MRGPFLVGEGPLPKKKGLLLVGGGPLPVVKGPLLVDKGPFAVGRGTVVLLRARFVNVGAPFAQVKAAPARFQETLPRVGAASPRENGAFDDESRPSHLLKRRGRDFL